MGDQVVSSLTNFGVSFVVLRSASLEDFGVFSVSFAAFVLSIATVRSLVGQPAASLLPRHAEDERPALIGSAARFAILLGVTSGTVVAIIGAVAGGELRSALWVLALSLPFLLLQDSLRFVAFATAEPKSAFLMDCAWAIGQAVSIAAVLLWTDRSIWLFVGGWALSGAIVGLAGWYLLVLRRCRDRETFGWFARTRELGVRFLLEAGLQAGAMQAVLLATAAIAGVGELGRLNGARTIFGPMTVMVLGAELFGISEGASLVNRGAFDRLGKLVSAIGVVLAVAPMLFLAVVLVLPVSFMEDLAGSSWVEIRGLFWAVAAVTAFQGIAWAYRIGLRARVDARTSLSAQVKSGPLIFVLGSAGAITAGALGSLMGVAVATAVSSVIFARAFINSNKVDAGNQKVRPAYGH